MSATQPKAEPRNPADLASHYIRGAEVPWTKMTQALVILAAGQRSPGARLFQARPAFAISAGI